MSRDSEILTHCPDCKRILSLVPVNMDEIHLLCSHCRKIFIISSGILQGFLMAPIPNDEFLLSSAQKTISDNYSPSPLYYPDYIKVMQSYEREYLLPVIGFMRRNVRSLVDICCGPGTLLEIGRALTINSIGVDLNLWTPFAKDPANTPVSVLKCNILDLDWLEEVLRHIFPCDLLVCTEGLEHFAHDIRPSFKLMIRFLSPRWIYFSTTTREFGDGCGKLEITYFRNLPKWNKEELNGNHHKAWTLSELSDFMMELGYKTVGWSLQKGWIISQEVDISKFIRVLALGEKVS